MATQQAKRTNAMPLNKAASAHEIANKKAKTSNNQPATSARVVQQKRTRPRRNGMEHSGLSRLPGELRNIIWTMVMTHQESIKFESEYFHCGIRRYNNLMSQALNVMLSSKQVLNETRGLFFHLNQVELFGVPSTSHQRRFSKLLRETPSVLCSNLNRIVLWPENFTFVVHRKDRRGDGVTSRNMDRLAGFLGNVQIPRTSQLWMGSTIVYHRWGGRDRHICKRDAPVSGDDCGTIDLVFPIGDREAALTIVDQLYQNRLSKLTPHRQHRMCTVRIELDKILDGLEKAHRVMLDLVDRTCKLPDQVAQGKAGLTSGSE